MHVSTHVDMAHKPYSGDSSNRSRCLITGNALNQPKRTVSTTINVHNTRKAPASLRMRCLLVHTGSYSLPWRWFSVGSPGTLVSGGCSHPRGACPGATRWHCETSSSAGGTSALP